MSRNRTAPTLELPAGKDTQSQPLAHVPGARARTDRSQRAKEEPADDTIRRSADKARWGYSTNMAELVAEQKAIEAMNAEEQEEEEEEEEEEE